MAVTNTGFTANSSAEGLLYSDPNGVVQTVDDGLANQVLTSNGAGAAPTMQYLRTSAGTLWLFKAKTSATSGYPGDGYMLWDNATQILATNLLVAHLTSDDLDVDILLSNIAIGATILLQDSDDSLNFQKWTVSGASTNTNPGTATSYWTFPVTLVSSGGTGTTNFANNHQLVMAIAAAAGAGTGTVTNVSVVTANGFSGSVANPTTTPAITLTLGANAVTYGQLQLATGASKLIGSPSTGPAIGEITLGSGLALSGTTLSATGSGGTVTNVTASAPITSSGGATPNIAIPAANGSTDGYLSSADWTTFNNKNGTGLSYAMARGIIMQ